MLQNEAGAGKKESGKERKNEHVPGVREPLCRGLPVSLRLACPPQLAPQLQTETHTSAGLETETKTKTETDREGHKETSTIVHEHMQKWL